MTVAGPRVVILGGGMGGLTTAWELSSGEWREHLDSITVYQRGWRLGGKGASSRGRFGRIEEHGLHVLLGYYDATFRVLREVYGELDRAVTDPECPIRSWRDAVSPAADVGLAEWEGPTWSHLVTQFSGNDAIPGEPGAEDRPIQPLDMATRALRLLLDFHRAVAARRAPAQVYVSGSPVPKAGSLRLGDTRSGAGLTALAALLEAVERGARLTTGLGYRLVEALAAVLQRWRDGMRRVYWPIRGFRRTWQLVDLIVTNVQGMAADGLLSGTGYERIDHLDYRDWLTRHGAARETIDSPIVRGMYDLTFAYQGGDRATSGSPQASVSSWPFACSSISRDRSFGACRRVWGNHLRPALRGARPARCRVPLLPSAGPPAAHRWPRHLIDRPQPSGESEAGTRPLRAAGPSPRTSLLARPAPCRPAGHRSR